MMQPRFLLTLIVPAQLMVYPICELYESIDTGIIKPLLTAIGGSGGVHLKIGIFDLGLVLGSTLNCIIGIVLLMLVLRFALFCTWRWISKLLPTAIVPLQVEEPIVESPQPVSSPP